MSTNAILQYAPLGIICAALLVGLILALVRWPHHPGVSLTAMLGCAVLLVNLVAGTALERWIWSGPVDEQTRFLVRIVSWSRVTVSAVGYGLLFWAIFGWRGRQRFAPQYGPRYDEPRFGDAQPGRRSDEPGETERGRPDEIRKPRE